MKKHVVVTIEVTAVIDTEGTLTEKGIKDALGGIDIPELVEIKAEAFHPETGIVDLTKELEDAFNSDK